MKIKEAMAVNKKCTILYENILICKFMTYTEFKVAITHLLFYRSY